MAEQKPGDREKQIEHANRIMKTIVHSVRQGQKVSGITSFDVASLLVYVQPYFEQPPMLLDVPVPVSICGDVHGQITDVIRLFDQHKWPPKTRYLFLGDYVDRGPNSVDTIALLFALKVLHPDSIHLLRGNHETKAVNAVYGFKEELQKRFPNKMPGNDGKQVDAGTALWQNFNRVFGYMPLAALVNNRILCMHGGISPNLTSLDQIRKLPRPMNKFPNEGLEIDLLWADPDEKAKGFVKSPRGVSYTFGEDAIIDKCAELELDMIARAHQVVEEGYKVIASGHMITLFSAPDYCNQFHNHAGVLMIDENMNCKVKVVPSKTKAVEKKGAQKK